MNMQRVDTDTATDAPPAIVADVTAALAGVPANDNPARMPIARIDRAALAAAVQLASIVTERRNTIPILAHVLLRRDAGGLIVETTDLDLTARIMVAAQADAGFALAVPTHLFHSTLKKACAADVALDIVQQPEMVEHRTPGRAPSYSVIPGKVAVRLGSSNASLSTALPADWPKDRQWNVEQTFTVDAATFCEALRRTRFAISTEETRYYLNGVYLHATPPAHGVARHNGDRGKLRMVATDGHRLAQFDIAAPEGCEGMPGVIVPRKCVDVVLKLFTPPKAKKNQPAPATMINIAVGQAGIRFEAGGIVLISKVIDGTFPDYGRVIPLGNPHQLTVDRDGLAAMIDRVATVCSQRGRAVRLTIENNRITASVKNPDAGDTSESMECDWTGDWLDVGFNSGYLLDILDHVSTGKKGAAERVTMMLADPGSPALIRNADGSGPLCVQMPMRV